jgi:hypothetical protein
MKKKTVIFDILLRICLENYHNYYIMYIFNNIIGYYTIYCCYLSTWRHIYR